MANIAFDAVYKSETAPGLSLTYSHTCTGSNLVLFVGAHILSNSDFVSSITYNGVALTRVATVSSTGSSRTYLYLLIAPATGTHDVVVNVSSPITIRATSGSYTGAQQVLQPDASTTQSTASGTTQTVSLSTVADNCWMISFCAEGASNPTAGTGTTLRDSTTGRALGDSNAAIHPAGSYSMTWNASATNFIEICQASFVPAPNAGGAFLFNFL